MGNDFEHALRVLAANSRKVRETEHWRDELRMVDDLTAFRALWQLLPALAAETERSANYRDMVLHGDLRKAVRGEVLTRLDLLTTPQSGAIIWHVKQAAEVLWPGDFELQGALRLVPVAPL